MKVIDMSLSDIKPYENNPRENADAIDKVAESIKEFGFQQPIVVDTQGIIIVGHTRYEAAKKLGLDTVPVNVADLPEEKAKAYRLADNKVAEYSYWDFDKLEKEFDDLKFSDVDFSALGFVVPADEEGITDVTDDENGNVTSDGNDGNDGNESGEEFAPIDENIKTEHVCPKCGYEW